MDYIFFMAVLSFDFLLLDSFSDLNEYQDGLERILMVCAGGLITCSVGTVLLPQYAGQELVALSASAFEGTATELEVTASALVMAGRASTHGQSAQPSKIDMATVKRLVYLSHYEIPCLSAQGQRSSGRGGRGSSRVPDEGDQEAMAAALLPDALGEADPGLPGSPGAP